MSQRPLHPCPSCAQHLRAGETVCPFCDAALPAGFGASARPRGAPGRPSSRAALLFAAATVAAGCGGATEANVFGEGDGGHDAAPGDGSGGDDYGQPVALYGPAPVYDAGPRPDASKDAATDATEEDSGGGVILYGPAPYDAGHSD
jgi:hypothetical protein